jgi:hypothetical protein
MRAKLGDQDVTKRLKVVDDVHVSKPCATSNPPSILEAPVGELARGYKWRNAWPGNLLALKHGANSDGPSLKKTALDQKTTAGAGVEHFDSPCVRSDDLATSVLRAAVELAHASTRSDRPTARAAACRDTPCCDSPELINPRLSKLALGHIHRNQVQNREPSASGKRCARLRDTWCTSGVSDARVDRSLTVDSPPLRGNDARG